MLSYSNEPTLQDLLSDPLVRLVMAADGVDGHELQAMADDVMRQRKAHRQSENI